MSDITEFAPKQQRFIHLYASGNYTNQELAEILDVHVNTISKWANTPAIRTEVENMLSDTHKHVEIRTKAAATQALDKMVELLESPIDGVALQAAKDLLDRAGHKAKQEIKIDKTVVTYEQKLADLINNTINLEDVIDVE